MLCVSALTLPRDNSETTFGNKTARASATCRQSDDDAKHLSGGGERLALKRKFQSHGSGAPIRKGPHQRHCNGLRNTGLQPVGDLTLDGQSQAGPDTLLGEEAVQQAELRVHLLPVHSPHHSRWSSHVDRNNPTLTVMLGKSRLGQVAERPLRNTNLDHSWNTDLRGFDTSNLP